jgi:nucleoside-diphosphate-sugar epimerase
MGLRNCAHRLGVFQILFDWVEGGHKIPIIGNGTNRYQLLEVDDLAAACFLSYRHEGDEANDVFNIGTKTQMVVNEYLGGLLEHAKSGSKLLHVPAWLVIPALTLFEWLHLSPLYKWVYGTAHTDSFVSVDKARHILGWEPEYSEKDALIRSYNWYIENKESIATEAGTSHRVPWAQGILGIIKKFM